MARTKNKKNNSHGEALVGNDVDYASLPQESRALAVKHGEEYPDVMEPESRRRSSRPMEDEDDFFIDESLIRLLNILLPRMKYVVLFSLLAAFLVGFKIFFFNPRVYSCSAIIAPDVMPDLTSVDLVKMTADSGASIVPIANQLSQLRALASSSQVKRNIIQHLGLMKVWDCRDELDCINKLNGVYEVQEVRQVGIKVAAQSVDPDLSYDVVNVGIDETNSFFKDLMQKRAQESMTQIQSWINGVTKEIELVSSEYINFASTHNITDIESQFSAGNALLGSIKQSIVNKESELTQLQQEYGEGTRELMPLQESLRELRETMRALIEGTDEDSIYPALSRYEYLRMRIQDYQQKIDLLRNRLDLFNRQLATAQIESQKQARSVMVLDEPVVTPVGKGTVKFTVLTFIAVFFFACIFILMLEYWRTIRGLVYSQRQE